MEVRKKIRYIYQGQNHNDKIIMPSSQKQWFARYRKAHTQRWTN